jgi:imidazoleglycerol phosphate dehydratase HisB
VPAAIPDRRALVERNTLETRIRVSVDLDGTGLSRFKTGLPFLEHMLDQVARHGLIDLEIEAEGDLHIDAHHTAEDIGITLGQPWLARSAPSRASAATAMPMCPWTRRSPGWWWTSLGDPA